MFRFALIGAFLLLILPACSHRKNPDELNRQLLDAARKGESKAVEHLLKEGANIEAKDQNRSTPLAVAIDYGNPQVAALLLAKGASLPGAGIAGEDALVEAARDGLVHRTEFLFKRNPTPRQKKDDALFALALAAPVFVKASVEPMSLPPLQAKTPVRLLSNTRTAELLLTNGAGLEAHDVDGATPLIRASTCGNTEVTRVLLDRGANIEARDHNGQTALIAAACECASIDMPETIDVLKLLMEKKAEVNARDNTGRTALMAAAEAGETDNVRFLIDSGAKLEARDDHGNTALMLASGAGPYNAVRAVETAESVKVLLSRRANATLRNMRGQTALDLAKKSGRNDVLAILKSAMKR